MWPPGRTESTPLPWAPPLWPHRPGIHLLHCLQPSLSEEGTLYQPTPRLCPVPRVAHCSFLSRIELRSPLRFPLLPNQGTEPPPTDSGGDPGGERCGRLTLERAEPAPHGEALLRPQHGRQARARWAPARPPHPGSILGDVRSIRRLPHPPPALQPSHSKAQLGFPHPDAIKKFRMWLGEEGWRS